ncbi:MAG: fumarylacetoacetase [Actinomycetia bacterium]|nr:fumarylacetoacetase [Actinomycetes bacterium]
MSTRGWLPVRDQDFSLDNLPFGVVRPPLGPRRVVTRIGDYVLDLAAAGIEPQLTAQPTLNALLLSGRGGDVRARAADVLTGRERLDLVHALDDVDVLMPFDVRDYVDFYSSLHHATNMGRILRPESEPLLPNWRQLPVGYHGRSGTVVVTGTDVARPEGLVAGADGVPRLVPTDALDFELEVGFVVGGPPATRISPDDAHHHVFGAVLCNDWSARDVQSFEYQPLVPNLAKSFATTISAWVVTFDALRPYLVAPPCQEPAPDPYLRATRPWAIDLHLEVDLNGTTITATNFATMYWTFAQQLAHITVNGATTRGGDLFASGTVSGPTAGELGSLMEATWQGTRPLELADGTTRAFLADGDTVTLRGWCGGDEPGRPRIGFGDATGTVVAAPARRRHAEEA